MDVRLCGWCGAGIDHRAGNARFCDRKCAWKANYRANPERHRAQTSQWSAANPDYGREWQRVNREARRDSYRRSYAKHRDRRRADNRAWEARNPGAHVARTMNRRARLVTNFGSVGVTVRDWLRLVRRYGGRCAYCGTTPKTTPQMDHVIPLARGGRHAIGNVLPACSECNLSKGAALLAEWHRRTKRSAADTAGCASPDMGVITDGRPRTSAQDAAAACA